MLFMYSNRMKAKIKPGIHALIDLPGRGIKALCAVGCVLLTPIHSLDFDRMFYNPRFGLGPVHNIVEGMSV